MLNRCLAATKTKFFPPIRTEEDRRKILKDSTLSLCGCTCAILGLGINILTPYFGPKHQIFVHDMDYQDSNNPLRLIMGLATTIIGLLAFCFATQSVLRKCQVILLKKRELERRNFTPLPSNPQEV